MMDANLKKYNYLNARVDETTTCLVERLNLISSSECQRPERKNS